MDARPALRRSALLLAPGGCAGAQSALDPAGPAAASIHLAGLIMSWGGAAVTLLVVALMLWPFVRRRASPVNRRLFLWGGGVALPTLTLLALVPYILTVGVDMRAETGDRHVSIDVTGHLYWWDVAYRTPGGRVVTANELRIPAGEPVEVMLRSEDVIHSFWVPSLAGKTDMIPGRVNRMTISADRPGRWRGACAEYCGLQHALMAFEVVALPRPEYDRWLARLAAPVARPATAERRTGEALFVAKGCASCHGVRGLSAARIGPDLSQVGSRRLIGAGALGGGVGNLAGWISSAQHLKPDARMPSYDALEGRELRALAAYLDGLR